MSRHSKNNTAASFFTHAERQKLDYGTQKQRLGKDSMRDFDVCFLCLSRARDPVSCLKGHISCKECILENMYAQKQEILRKQKLVDEQNVRFDEEDKEKTEKIRGEKIRQFEQTQAVSGSDGEKIISKSIFCICSATV
ncbi:hypothetical protein HK096_008557 [Nowakowskiella sp. JEL0078]|nr:hypothetical protein HK096_008557 [Nowakowskiella sp. JEL0078]